MDDLKKSIVINDLTPSEFYLCKNYPNPFKENTSIKYCVAYKTYVQLTVYNSDGKEIEKLVDEEKNPGTYKVEFDASSCHSCNDRDLEREIFHYCLEAGDYKSEKKMLLTK